MPEALVHFQTSKRAFNKRIIALASLFYVFAEIVKHFNIFAIVVFKLCIAPVLNLRPHVIARGQSVEFANCLVLPDGFNRDEGGTLVVAVAHLWSVYDAVEAFGSAASPVDAPADHGTVHCSRLWFWLAMALISISGADPGGATSFTMIETARAIVLCYIPTIPLVRVALH